jgi:hypothetical protein
LAIHVTGLNAYETGLNDYKTGLTAHETVLPQCKQVSTPLNTYEKV